MYKYYFLFLFLLTAKFSGAQEALQEGFQYLEKENYKEAENFFPRYFEEYNKTARICYARAVGLGGAASKSLVLLKELSEDYPDDKEVLLNLGECALWNNDPEAAIKIYGDLLEIHPEDFVANLGYANAQAAMVNEDVAVSYIIKALELNPQNSAALVSYENILISKAYKLYKGGASGEAAAWLEKVFEVAPNSSKALALMGLIKRERKTEVVLRYQANKDVGGNVSQEKGIRISYKLTPKNRISFDANLRTSEQLLTQAIATQQGLIISDKIHVNSKFRLDLGLGVASSRSESVSVNRVLKRAGLEGFWSERLYTKFEYYTEAHNYTVDLIEKNILMQHHSAAANYNLKSRFGIYANAVYTTQSDLNKRRLFFGSLYYSLVEVPLVRFGLNYNYLSFAEDNKNYFSPDVYQLGEFFMLLDNEYSDSALKFKLQASIGGQRIDAFDYQKVNRIELSLGYSLGKGIMLHGNYLANTAASATALGQYSFQQGTIRLSAIF